MKNPLLFLLLCLAGTAHGQTTDFVFTVNTSNVGPGSSGPTQFAIPTTGTGYGYSVNWGDATAPTASTASVTHTYAAAGNYTVRVSGIFPRIFFNNGGDKLKISAVAQWGSAIAWASFANAFQGCSNLTVTATDAPLLTGVASLTYMFMGCTLLTSLGVTATSWNTSNVTDMSYMFSGAKAFKGDIGGWKTDKVTTMSNMFLNAKAFNGAIGGWATSTVTNMVNMFNGATVFNGAINSWNTANVTSMSGMFSDAAAFNGDISKWNVLGVTTMSTMFSGAAAFNQDISNWKTDNVTGMSGMFSGAAAFNWPIGGWVTAKVTTMSSMFYSATAFNGTIGSWNTASVLNMSSMFCGATAFNQSLKGWAIPLVTNMANMLDNSGLSTANYDSTLIGWQAGTHKGSIQLGAAALKYCTSSDKRALLTGTGATNVWAISGDAPGYTTAVSTLAGAGSATSLVPAACPDANNNLWFATAAAGYLAINPNGNTGYSFTATAANNSPAVNNQSKTDATLNTTALSNRIYTITDAGTNSYPGGMKVRIYYDPADLAAANAALDPRVPSSGTGNWFKISGSGHAANVAVILAAQTATGIPGASFLLPTLGTESNGVAYAEFTGITSFSTFGYLAARTSGILPVTLVGFTATAAGCAARLAWNTATELNNPYFEIESSTDAAGFAQIGQMRSQNSAMGAAYTYVAPLGGGTTYFRLKALDLDGKFSYGPVVPVTGAGPCGTVSRVRVFPNPGSSVVTVQNFPIGSTISLLNGSGQRLIKMPATGNSQSMDINILIYPKGLYHVHIQAIDGSEKNIKMIKQ